METNILKEIFFDEHAHWDNFVKKHNGEIRPIVIKEVEKFRVVWRALYKRIVRNVMIEIKKDFIDPL